MPSDPSPGWNMSLMLGPFEAVRNVVSLSHRRGDTLKGSNPTPAFTVKTLNVSLLRFPSFSLTDQWHPKLDGFCSSLSGRLKFDSKFWPNRPGSEKWCHDIHIMVISFCIVVISRFKIFIKQREINKANIVRVHNRNQKTFLDTACSEKRS